MTAGRWQVVKTILQSAVERPASERQAFVLEACKGDDTIRQEVELLLQAHEEAGDFLQGSVMDAVPRAPHDDTIATLVPGRRIGSYRVERELGRGGMGAVYLAVRADDEFQRQVAIKLIKRGMDTDEIIQRFRRERQILADLDHPNIARLIDGGSTEDGLPYFVMEYVEGEPVNVYADVRKLSVNERLNLFSKICGAVQHAHTHRIIHRDVKPRNILVTKDGTPKLLDFGIAKLLNPGVDTQVRELTLAPQRLMTPEYASPEQVSGRPVSAASDVYSLGVLLYELLTGRKPFELWNRRMDEVARIICEEAPQRPSSRRLLEAPLDNIVLKALRKDPLERYASAQEFANDIARFQEGQPVLAGFHAGGVTEPPTGPRSLAVLPFRTLRTEEHTDEYLGISLADALITKLTNIRRLTVRPTSSVHKYAHGDYDTLAAARDLEVEYVIDGRTRRSGDRVRVTVQLIRVADSAPVWGAKFDEKFTDILTLEDSISGMVAEAIMPRLTGEEKELLSKRETENPKAYESYLRGRYFLNKYSEEGLAKSLVCFMEAVAEDPNYARAHAGVSEYHSWLGAWCVLPAKECFAAAMDSAKKALALDPQLAEGHACKGWAAMPFEWDWAAAEAGLRKSIEIHPASTTYRWLAIVLTCMGRHAEAIGEVENAQKLDPLSSVVVCTVALIFFNARQYGRALEELKRAHELDPDNFLIHLSFGWCYLQKKMYPEALASARRAVAVSKNNQHAASLLGYALAVSRHTEDARRVLGELEETAKTRYVSPYLIALVQLGLGERSAALDSLEKAAATRDWWVVWLGTEPRLDELRPEPRFQALLRRIGLAPAQVPAKPRLSRRAALAISATAAVAALLLGARTYFSSAGPALPFSSPQFTKLTTDGVATAAAISPDGRYVAYAALTNGHNGLWVRQVGIANRIQIVPPAQLTYRGLAFSRDSNYVNYVVYRTNQIADGELYQVPVLGGTPRKLAEHVSGAVSVSPDNRHRAFLRSNPSKGEDELIALSEDASQQKMVASRKHPVRFAYASMPAWSPDGKMIACAVENTDAQGFFVSIFGFNVQDGSEKLLAPLRWQYVEQMAWSPAGNGLIVAGRDQEGSFQQVWEIAYPGGAARKLTNDLSDYYGISLTADASALVTVQKQTLSNVWTAPKLDSTAATQITPAAGRYFDLSWTPDGRIAYASDASGAADLWIMEGDGSGQKQLTANAHRNYAPAASPDGKYIAFHSNRSGAWNIWRMDLDGGHPTQLTNDAKDSNWPQWTPDSKWLVYHHIGSGGFQTLWKVPVDGGQPVQLSDQVSLRPIVSPIDGSIACWYADADGKQHWRLAVIPPQGGKPVKLFEFAPTVSVDTHLRWTPDGKGLAYSNYKDGMANLWIQPLEGGPPRQITKLTRDMIFAFDWSRDGRLAYSRGFSTSDVVLMSEKK